MSTQPIASYTFLPWARQGLGTYIEQADAPPSDPNDPNVVLRGSFGMSLQLTGERIGGGTITEPIPQTVQLLGPGDVIGIESRAYVRTEPNERNHITNFEPNYMPFIEFYDEDFPWRYTPAKQSADERRLRPWITLVVLEHKVEYDDAPVLPGQPLPAIVVEDAAEKFPPPAQLWAWAHVHVDGGMGVDLDSPDRLAAKLDDVVRTNRDLAYSRLLCPRTLKPNTPYDAFLIPTFESGRLAGLGLSPDTAPYSTACAWVHENGYVPADGGTTFPYYHRWYFRTGTVGDFEYLVRLLEARTVDPRVGRRDFDVMDPGSNIADIPELGGILRLGGALQAPVASLKGKDLQEYEDFEGWAGDSTPHPFQVDIAALINLADEYQTETVASVHSTSPAPGLDEDPVIVPPLYGRWHSQTHRLAPEHAQANDNMWVQELNMDPRHRVAAGFGTDVIQKNQEEYMEAAWKQVGDVLKANEKIRLAQLAKFTTSVWHQKGLTVLKEKAPERFFTVAAPVNRRVLMEGQTIHYSLRESTVPNAMVSTTMRKALRPGGRIAKHVGFNEKAHPGNLLIRVNSGEVSAAPPKTISPNLVTSEQIATAFGPKGLPADWIEFLRKHPWSVWLPLVFAIVLALVLLLIGFGIAAGPLLLVGAGVSAWLLSLVRKAAAVDVFRPETRTPEAVDAMRTSPNFKIGEPTASPGLRFDGPDSEDARRFKSALTNAYKVDALARSTRAPRRKPVNLTAMVDVTLAGLKPEVTITKRTFEAISIPARIKDKLVRLFDRIMAYPVIDEPMYMPLRNISSELLVPNLQLIGNNTITLLETNQKFIEAYMVGINHEFNRELLWREYPTDQRGTSFRQFWDVSGFLSTEPLSELQLKEKLRDIKEIHTWDTESGLGTHDNREEPQQAGTDDPELVLAIRGELLKKYPNAVIYAHKAAWRKDEHGKDIKRPPRELFEPEDGDVTPYIKTPLYEATVPPDIYFRGFDLTAGVARGIDLPDGTKDAGWFFVIKERPGEPRFGLDVAKSTKTEHIYTWNDLAWSDVIANHDVHMYPDVLSKTFSVENVANQNDPAHAQNVDDKNVQWNSDVSASELAYILFQVPVMMAVHAEEMLEGL